MLSIKPIPAFNDNYIWLLQITGQSTAYVVDPGDAQAVEKALMEKSLDLAGILITHHHHDHTGGISELTRNRKIPVYGPVSSNISGITHPLSDGDQVLLAGITFQIIATPGHTLDHIVYFSATSEPILFCGDTLFGGGCGRLFEGSPELMFHSLNKLANLPENTKVYCAHEYTLSNLRFCTAVEPDNLRLQARIATDSLLREQNQPTIPTILSTELKTNPFLRCHVPSIITAAEQYSGEQLSDSVNVLRVIRAWKDNF